MQSYIVFTFTVIHYTFEIILAGYWDYCPMAEIHTTNIIPLSQRKKHAKTIKNVPKKI